MNKLINFVGYLVVTAGVVLIFPDDASTAQYVGSVLVLVGALAMDLASFSQGLRKGINIADEVLKDLCDAKKIKVVRNES